MNKITTPGIWDTIKVVTGLPKRTHIASISSATKSQYNYLFQTSSMEVQWEAVKLIILYILGNTHQKGMS